jgi:hypothetical protein
MLLLVMVDKETTARWSRHHFLPKVKKGKVATTQFVLQLLDPLNLLRSKRALRLVRFHLPESKTLVLALIGPS